ncbi:MAG: UDP-glucose/GDP-mannose dehydrogenase family protein [Alphaproteobacteria bacterium]|nr:UDP-glucose/GDP-mannose dehydrogenase family protein [Alphaproteobacteria bacterium]
MNLAIIGCGYVGLVTGACLADHGHQVICVDQDEPRIAALRQGVVPIFEPGLSEMILRNVARGRMSFSTDLAGAVQASQVVFIAVGTPSRPSDGLADLSYVYAAADAIGAAIAAGTGAFTVVVNKSTVPIGTGDEVEAILTKHVEQGHFAVVSNPEFLREGDAIADFMHPDRVVIGADADQARAVMAQVYAPMQLAEGRLVFMRRRSAEITKYAANAFLVTKISFINEFADLCEKTGANVEDVARGIGLDSRIGPKFLNVGPGYGGSCFPKDTSALVRSSQAAGLKGKSVALLGLAFKANTDDMRGAPALSIVEALLAMGAQIKAYDPASMEQARALMPSLTYCDSAWSCLARADVAAVLTEWSEFRALDPKQIRQVMAHPILVDLRNIYDPAVMRAEGIMYSSVGRP